MIKMTLTEKQKDQFIRELKDNSKLALWLLFGFKK
tara:strand:+ start:138 stop:242 length:105 start_codon:yes stop_codon:yes gene_type:complete